MTLVSVLLVWPRAARAGNDDEVLIGNDAAMMGGAVTPIIADGAAAWYNPAGIAAADRDKIDASASVFTLRSYDVSRFISARSGESTDGNVTEFLSIPSMLTLTKRVTDGVNLSLGLFVPASNDIALREELRTRPVEDARSLWTLNLAGERTRYHVGPGIGWRLLPNLRLGASLLGVYATERVAGHVAGGVRSGDAGGVAGTGVFESSSVFGVEMRAGIQWEPVRNLRVGLSLRTPRLDFLVKRRHTQVDISASGSASSLDELELKPTDQAVTDFGAAVTTPLRLRAGIAYARERGMIVIEGDVQPPLQEHFTFRDGDQEVPLSVDRQLTWNIRVGGQAHLGDRWTLGAGAFTDRSPEPRPRDFGDMNPDFYGVTGGVTMHSPHVLAEGEDAENLVFSTTLAMRYAYGSGKFGGLHIDLSRDESISSTLTDVTVHELSLHIGSSLRF